MGLSPIRPQPRARTGHRGAPRSADFLPKGDEGLASGSRVQSYLSPLSTGRAGLRAAGTGRARRGATGCPSGSGTEGAPAPEPLAPFPAPMPGPHGALTGAARPVGRRRAGSPAPASLGWTLDRPGRRGRCGRVARNPRPETGGEPWTEAERNPISSGHGWGPNGSPVQERARSSFDAALALLS